MTFLTVDSPQFVKSPKKGPKTPLYGVPTFAERGKYNEPSPEVEMKKHTADGAAQLNQSWFSSVVAALQSFCGG